MREEEIRKRETFNKYLELVEKDVKEFFDFHSFLDINCPACGSRDNIFEFEKLKFRYVSCKDCSTLFVSPRPALSALKDFYTKSSSASFWVNQFFKPVTEARREKIFVPRAKYICETLNPDKEWIIGDIGSGFGLFLEELRKILPENRYIAIEPHQAMADICQGKKLELRRSCLEELNEMDTTFNLLTTFELFEHLYDPADFLKKVYSLLKPGGYLLLTTLSSEGFDILLLWERSKSIFPPHHLNFFNPLSIRHLLERIGFEIVEISTPGELDWDIVEGMIKHENIDLGRFWNLLAQAGSRECKRELQDWILNNKLSSHMRILVNKPGA